MRWLAACVLSIGVVGCTQWTYELGEPLAEAALHRAGEAQDLAFYRP